MERRLGHSNCKRNLTLFNIKIDFYFQINFFFYWGMNDYLSVIRKCNSLLEDEINERKCTNINLQHIPQYPKKPQKPQNSGYYIYKGKLRWFDGTKLCCKHKKKISKNCYFCKYGDGNVFENSSSKCPNGYWKTLENKKKYIGFLANKLGFTCYEHWYKIQKKDFQKNKGAGLLAEYFKKNKSSKNLLYDVFPNYNWVPFLFTVIENGWWGEKENHYIFMNYLIKEEKFNNIFPGLYNLTVEQIMKYHGKCLIYTGSVEYTNSSSICSAVHKLVLRLYPQYKWIVWKFKTVGNGVWKNEKYLKEYMLELQKELNFNTPEAWYYVTREDFVNFYGNTPITKYGIVGMLKYLYPQYQFDKDKFIQNNNYKLICNRIQEINNMTTEELENEYNKPFYNFINCENKRLPEILWKNKELQKISLLWLGKKLGYTKSEHWYNISKEKIKENELSGLLVHNNGGHVQLIMSVFNDYNLLEWKFLIAPHNFWDNKENQKKYIIWLGKKLGYTKMEDWYKISWYDFIMNNGRSIVKKYSPYYQVIIDTFPEYEWEIGKFKNLKTEGKIHDWLNEHSEKLHINNITHKYKPEWANLKETHNTFYEFDFNIELTIGVNIIIEIDGAYHYKQVSNWNSPEYTQKRDRDKEKLAKENHHSLIRLNQEDVLSDKNNWEDNLIAFISYLYYENIQKPEIYDCSGKERYNKN